MPDTPHPGIAKILTGPVAYAYWGLVLIWAATAAWFWVWWLDPAHNASPLRYWTVTSLLGWITFLQAYFIFFSVRAVRCVAPDPEPGAWRVAMIVTKTPSEPFAIVERTLLAMLTQDYPHDTWLADEDPSDDTRRWCAAHGVKLSSRKGVAAYHQAKWPRRTRCKEGNLAYFYDHFGYDAYDIVSQLDADHVPQPGYLREMIRPFAGPNVGYVSAPSICASNAAQNWATRTRLHTEGAFHGVLQAGYSNGFAPMCIGSHYAVRTAALKAVGGVGPELAEDHSTTMILNAGGWRGVHAIDAIAIGDGPTTVADLATQEFQWSRSLVTLLLQHTPRYLPTLSPRLRAQFLFCQMLYPIFGLTFLAMYLLPIYAIVFDVRFAEVTFPQYLGHAVPQILGILAIAILLRRSHVFRPTDAPVISWERTLFIMLQWPWVLWGCVAAVRDTVSGKFVDFRITPKGEGPRAALPFKIVAVYAVLALGCIVPVISVDGLQNAQGFYILTLFSGLLYSLTLIVVIVRHYGELGWKLAGVWRGFVAQSVLATTIVLMFGTALTFRAAESVYALAIGLEPIKLVQVNSRVAGAGSAGRNQVEYLFTFEFIRPVSGSPQVSTN